MNPLGKAINNLGVKGIIKLNGELFKLACLIRNEDRRPFRASWWKEKEAYLIAVDVNGVFFLRCSGGAIHKTQPKAKKSEQIAKSEKEFISMINWNNPENVVEK